MWTRACAAAAAVMLAACGGGDESRTEPAATAETTTTTATTAPRRPRATSTTTTTVSPLVPRPSGVQAVDDFLAAWRAGDRAGAATVAEPEAVERMFAIAVEAPEHRGCNEPPPGLGAPVYCVYRLAAGELQVRAVEHDGGWIVDLVILSDH